VPLDLQTNNEVLKRENNSRTEGKYTANEVLAQPSIVHCVFHFFIFCCLNWQIKPIKARKGSFQAWMALNNQIIECLELLNAAQPSDCCVRDLVQDFEENAEPKGDVAKDS
jgi:hypothetical protein